MDRQAIALVSATALMLAGCDNSAKQGEKVLAAIESNDAEKGEVALSKEPCEPKLSDAPRPADAGGDDIVGIFPGQSVTDAAAILACRGNMAELLIEKETLREAGEAERRAALVATSGEPCEMNYRRSYESYFERGYGDECGIMGVEGSKPLHHRADRFRVALVGMPGAERVGAVWRTQDFTAGAEPIIKDLVETLIKKYGDPSRLDEGSSRVKLSWVKDLRGRPMSESNPAYSSCFGLNADADDSQRWTAACGQTVEAEIKPAPSNPLLASQLAVVSMHQAQQLAAQKEMQDALAALQERERAEQVERARASAAEVDL